MKCHHFEVLLNDFAIRSFRDTADRDYVHARLAYRAQLIPQFLWSSLHCLEKYAKCILVINRINARQIKHKVTPSIQMLAEHNRFQITLSDQSQKFIERLEDGAEFRYFEVSYFNERFDIARLDRVVWELRRYCQVLDHDIEIEGRTVNLLEPNLQRVRKAAEEHSKDTCLLSGWLENVIRDRKHPSREPLLWKNLFFGQSRRKTVTLHGFMESGNAPLYMHPEILDEVLKYVYLPCRVVKAWREELAEKASAPK